MSKLAKASLIPFIGLAGALLIFTAFTPGPVGAAGACGLSAGQVVINEVLPAPSDGVEWVELYNTTGGSLDLGNCYLDDIAAGGGSPLQIPAGSVIPAHAFWTLDRSSYFNNSGDDVRLLSDDAATILDSYTFGSTAYDQSWYRSPDGGAWASTPTSSPTSRSRSKERAEEFNRE